MWGDRTYVSDLNSSNACTTALKNIPDTLGLEPSCPRILASRSQIIRTFLSFPTTAGQSSSATVNTRPRYLEEVTVLSCLLQS